MSQLQLGAFTGSCDRQGWDLNEIRCRRDPRDVSNGRSLSMKNKPPGSPERRGRQGADESAHLHPRDWRVIEQHPQTCGTGAPTTSKRKWGAKALTRQPGSKWRWQLGAARGTGAKEDRHKAPPSIPLCRRPTKKNGVQHTPLRRAEMRQLLGYSTDWEDGSDGAAMGKCPQHSALPQDTSKVHP